MEIITVRKRRRGVAEITTGSGL